jgi:hypothetical protein
LTDLFTSQTENTPDPSKNYLEELVGEGKKFKSPEDLARGKAEADRFIQQLQGELAGIRQELGTRQTLEELMTKMTPNQSPNNQNQEHNQTPPGGEGNAPKAVTMEDIDRLVEDRLSKVEKERVHQSNLNQAKQALVNAFGSDYITHLKAKASELGVTEQYLNNMAMETPKAFLKLVEADTPRSGTTLPGTLFTPPQGHSLPQQSTKGFAPSGTPKMSHYEELKRKNPTEYWSPAVQNKMHKDAIALGPDFFDT